MMGKMWDQWIRLVKRGKDPGPMLGALIQWGILWVRYDRRIAGRSRGIDVYDYRARMVRHDLDGRGRARPAERGARENHWIDWGVAVHDDPALWAAARDALGV
jgi:hypothetical protein